MEKLTTEEWADYAIRSANGAPLDKPNPGLPAQEEPDPNAGMYADALPSGNVGDVNSTARGTGARFSAGKPKLEYIPMQVLLDVTPIGDPITRADLERVGACVASFESQLDTTAVNRAFGHIPDLYRIAETCAVFDYGAKKYAAWNWAKGMPWSVVLACFKRHWLALARGEAKDPESGRSHWGHIGCNLVMLSHFVRYYPEGDDRPPAAMFGKAD